MGFRCRINNRPPGGVSGGGGGEGCLGGCLRGCLRGCLGGCLGGCLDNALWIRSELSLKVPQRELVLPPYRTLSGPKKNKGAYAKMANYSIIPPTFDKFTESYPIVRYDSVVWGMKM